MKIFASITRCAATAAIGLGIALAGAPATQAQTPPSAGTDVFRSGGCTGCFATQASAAIASFSQIKRVFRTCNIGGTITAGSGATACIDGGTPQGRYADFLLLQGVLKDSTTDANGLGVVGGTGLGDVTYRISANGSQEGFECAAGTPTGFIAPEGLDGNPATGGDNAGIGSAANSFVVGTPPNNGTATAARARLEVCTNALAQFQSTITATGVSWAPSASNAFCVVETDRNSNATIDNQNAGVAPGTRTTVGGTPADSNETFNLKMGCDMGFGDVPNTDFESTAVNQIQLPAGTEAYGAQIFKIIASDDIRAANSRTSKIQLFDAQVENIFGPATAVNACGLPMLGGISRAGHHEANGESLRVCFRNVGSGTRETERLTFQANNNPIAKNHSLGAAVTNAQCLGQIDDPNDWPADLAPRPTVGAANRKTLIGNEATGDEVNCVANGDRAFGYVNACRANSNSYGVPLEGVDPDTNANNIRTLVECGMYRFWGPLAGAAKDPADVENVFRDGHQKALRSPVVFPNTGGGCSDYVPGDEVAFNKTSADDLYQVQFNPGGIQAGGANPVNNARAALICPGSVAAPGVLPTIP